LAITLPRRPGPKPETTRPTPDDPHPHQQRSQNAPPHLQEELFARATGLAGVVTADSRISVPGARAFFIAEGIPAGPPEAFQIDREFAHIHPSYDGSLHLTLPPEAYQEVLDKRWGEPHPISGTMMLFGPRDTEELEVIWRLLQESHRWAAGG
jgi:phospholipase/carboxylesterase